MPSSAGVGFDAVSSLVSQVVSGLVGTPPSRHAPPGSSPRTPPTSRNRVRSFTTTLRPLNSLSALASFLNRLSELAAVEEPSAMLPVARTGHATQRRSWDEVTAAVTAVLSDIQQRAGSLHAAVQPAFRDQSLDREWLATFEQMLVMASDSLFRTSSESSRSTTTPAPSVDASAAPTAAGTPDAPGSREPEAQGLSGAQGAAASEAHSDTAADEQPSVQTRGNYEYFPLAVFAYALTMIRAAEALQRFQTSVSASANSLLREVVREVSEGSGFDRTQVTSHASLCFCAAQTL
jgi:hypothetical protein